MTYEAIEIAIDICNVLQTVNMTFSFILYCAVNTAFRKTLTQFVRKCLCWREKKTESYKMISDTRKTSNTVVNLE